MVSARFWFPVASISLVSAVSGQNASLQDQLNACARTCQVRALAEYSCDIDFNATNTLATTPCYCSDSSPTYQATITCVQNSCSLVDTLSWQKTRASSCQIQPRDISRTILATSLTLWSLASISCFGRFLARSLAMGGPGFWWDDWLVLALWILSIQSAVVVVVEHMHQAGVDVIGATIDDIHVLNEWCYISEPFYIIATYGGKVVIALLYLRMWKTPGLIRSFSWSWVYLGVLGAVGCSVSCIGVKWPFPYYHGDSAIVRNWILGIYVPAVLYAFAALNIIADICLLLLPIPMVRSLRGLSRNNKIGVAFVFLLGFIATTASVVRLLTIPPLTNSLNVTYDFGLFLLACEAEQHLTMICVNVPAWTGLLTRGYTRVKQGMSSWGSTTAVYDLSEWSQLTREEVKATPTPAVDGNTRSVGVEV